MKISKGSCVWDVLEESHSFYITTDHAVLLKSSCRVVPDERWVDVTAECSASQMQAYHEGLAINQYAPGYRLRKVPAMTREDMVFIVERKEPA